LVHGRSFNETQGRLTHDVALLMARIRPPDNAAPAAQPESTEGKRCTLFVLRSQYVLLLPVGEINTDAVSGCIQQPLRSPIPSLKAALPCDLCFGASVSIQTNARFKCCSPTTNALADLSHDRKTRSVSRRNLAGAPVARSREHEVIPGACR